jgi:hypothetical protein
MGGAATTCLLDGPAFCAWPLVLGTKVAPMPPGERYDFFLSRRGSVATIAQEVTDVLKENGYKVCTQDYDIPITANFIEEMHEAVKNARDLVVLFTHDYGTASSSVQELLFAEVR